MSESRTDVIRRVFDEEGQHFVEVRRWPEDPSWIELRTLPEKCSGEYFGLLKLPLSPEMAEELGRALIAAAEECKA